MDNAFPRTSAIKELTSQDTTWASLAHLAGLSGYLVPFGNIIGPFLVWMLRRDDSWFATQEAKEAMNFNISWMIYTFILALPFFLIFFFMQLFTIGSIFFVLWLLLVLSFPIIELILTIIAAMKVKEGQGFRYPLTLRFFR